jgi:hypothetical protein
MKAGEQEKSALDLPRRSSIDSNFSARYSLEKNSQSYSTVTDLARLRGWSTFAPRLTAM